MGVLADACSLHARFLNESKGPAVRALRAQMDKPAYARRAIALLRAQPNLDDCARSGRGAGRRFRRRSGRALRRRQALITRRRVVLATGTFLGGKTFRGDVVTAEGRFGEAPAIGLAARCAGSAFRRSG